MPIPTVKELRNRPFFNGSAAWGEHEYTNWIDESMSWKTTCYVGDWSWLADLRLEGPEALKLLSDLSVNTFAKFDVGLVPYKTDRSRVDLHALPSHL
jgi:vanillate/3-O-methylgallate O-demethylase